jgi:electron transfer flavoprotein alpha subunit
MPILFIAEHNNERLRPATLCALQFAREIAAENDGSIEILIMGHGIQAVADDATHYGPTLMADDECLAHPLPEPMANIISAAVLDKKVTMIVAANTTWSRDIVSRAAGLLGGAMASDVTGHAWVQGELQLDRPMFAGSLNATVILEGDPKIITVRGSAYPAATRLDTPGPCSPVELNSLDLSSKTQYESVSLHDEGRPDATEARVVVSGGRAIGSSEEFERIVGTLADRLGGAAGSSRPLVDAGITPNDLQIGQTGKIVAPDLYIALGISGAIQHLAGMKNAKIVVAVNTDKEAPVFKYADYGIVGDLFEVGPLMAQEADKLKPG